jgi:hypothetical protein
MTSASREVVSTGRGPMVLIPITPARAVVTAGLALATILALVFLVLLGSQPNSWWYVPRMPIRVYKSSPLDQVIKQMEDHGVIPLGTEWETETLKQKHVTVSFWFLPTDLEALGQLAAAAQVVIEYPPAYHGELRGSIRVRRAGNDPVGLKAVYRPNLPRPRYAENSGRQ